MQETWDSCSIPESGRSPGLGNGNPLQYSCLENSSNRGTWQAQVHGITKSQTQLSHRMQWEHTVWHTELYSVLCGDLNGWKVQKGGHICVSMADSFCCAVETNTMLWSNYTAIKIKFNLSLICQIPSLCSIPSTQRYNPVHVKRQPLV